jgi:hypothetical protein
MQARRWSELYRLVSVTATERPRGSRRFADRVIVLVLLWAAFNHRPISWAVLRRNWPVWMQRLLPVLPSSTTMSRRLRRESVRLFLDRLLENAQGGRASIGLVRVLDGTALEVRGHSKDRQAGYGFGSGRKAKGYKLHVLLDSSGAIVGWRVAPMQVSEKVMARRLLLAADGLAYVLADNNYDTNLLHAIVRSRGGQLVAPRQRGVGPLRPGRETPGRLRSDEILRGPSASTFGRQLLRSRVLIERFFGNADSHAEALGELPAWVRTHRRVRLWVHAKLIVNAVRITQLKQAA